MSLAPSTPHRSAPVPFAVRDGIYCIPPNPSESRTPGRAPDRLLRCSGKDLKARKSVVEGHNRWVTSLAILRFDTIKDRRRPPRQVRANSKAVQLNHLRSAYINLCILTAAFSHSIMFSLSILLALKRISDQIKVKVLRVEVRVKSLVLIKY